MYVMPGLQVAHRAERLVDVAREDRGREPVADPVRDADRLVEVLDRDQRRRRAEDLLLRDPHLRIDVGEDRRPVEEALAELALGRRLAAGEELRALVRADPRVRVDLVERLLVDHGAEVGLGIPAGADPHLLGARDEPLLQLAVDRLVDDHAARGRAALPGGAEGRPDDPLHRELEVGVVHDDDRVLAAELEVDVLEVVGGRLRDRDSRLARAGEGDDRDVRVADEPLAGLLAVAVHEVDDPVRQARLAEQLDEALGQERRVLRRLQHDGVPADERGRELPGGDRDREVPGRDRADDADRHPHRHLELVAQLRGRRLAEEAAALAGHVDRHVDRLLDVAAGLREHLAHLAAHQLRQLVLLLLEQAREAEEDVAALGRRHEPPLLERGLRRLDGAIDVLGRRAREGPDRLTVRGYRDSNVSPEAASVHSPPT